MKDHWRLGIDVALGKTDKVFKHSAILLRKTGPTSHKYTWIGTPTVLILLRLKPEEQRSKEAGLERRTMVCYSVHASCSLSALRSERSPGKVSSSQCADRPHDCQSQDCHTPRPINNFGNINIYHVHHLFALKCCRRWFIRCGD